MPTPEQQRAKEEAAAALDRAERLAEQGRRIADGWRRSRQDNNYRTMLREMVLVNGEG